jgi:hypothetical protein
VGCFACGAAQEVVGCVYLRRNGAMYRSPLGPKMS